MLEMSAAEKNAKPGSLAELNQICQKADYKTKGNWMARHITRDMALPVTWLLLHTPATANHVTALSMGVILLAGCAFWTGSPAAVFLGAVLFQFWYLLDHVDGQIARYRKASSVTGVFFDYVTHHVVNLTVLMSLGAGSFRRTGEEGYLIAGFAGAVGVALFHALHDCEYKAFFQAFEKKLGKGEPVRLALSRPETRGERPRPAEGVSWPKRVYTWMHKLCEVHVFMNILTAAALAQWALGREGWTSALVLFYAWLAPAVLGIKLAYWVRTQAVDARLREWLGDTR